MLRPNMAGGFLKRDGLLLEMVALPIFETAWRRMA